MTKPRLTLKFIVLVPLLTVIVLVAGMSSYISLSFGQQDAAEESRYQQELSDSKAQQVSPRIKKVLVLHTLKAKRPWNVLFNRYFTEALQANDLSLANIEIEHLDLLQFKDPNYQDIVKKELKHKYSSSPPDIIIITFASTIKFILENDLFPDIPKIFVLPTPSGLDDVPHSVVLPFAFEFKNNIEHALTLLPDTKDIYVVAGNGLMDRRLESMFRDETKDFRDRVSFHYLDDLNVEELLRRLEQLPDDSFVYYLTYSLDFQGKAVITRDFSKSIGQRSNRPVFSWLDLHALDIGILGGRVTTTRASATMSLDIVQRVFQGESIDTIKPHIPYVEYIYQWSELKKWGVDPGKLPPDSIIQNRPDNYFEIFKWQIIGWIFLLVAESLLVFFLLINIRKRKTAEHRLKGNQVVLETKFIEQKKNKNELQQSEERYKLAVAGSAAGIWDWDINSGKVYYSSRFKQLLGYGAEEPWESTDDFFNRLHPDDVQTVRAANEEHLEDGALYRIDFRLQSKSGEYLWFYARGQALWDESGKAVRMSGSITDITDRKSVTEELRKSELRFRSLMEQSPLAMELLTQEGKIVQVNSAWRILWGVNEKEAAEVMEKYNMLDDDQNKDLGVDELIMKGFAGENMVLPPVEYNAQQTADEFNIEGLNAKRAWIQCHLNPIRNEKHEIEFIVNTYVDVSTLKKKEEEANRQQEIMARIGRTTRMGQLTGSIAHEINQPLTGILSNAQAGEIMIQNGEYDNNELADILTDIVADTKRAGEVLHNLRELYREQQGKHKPIDLNTIVDETIKLINSEFVKENVQVTVKKDSSIPILQGNKIQIQQVLVNLIMNGNQAMDCIPRVKRRLNIVTAFDENKAKAWVEDSGPGIDPDKIDDIFEPLVTWKSGGTGMGLAISNSIIEAHGGKMWAENISTGGARVGISLPVWKEQEKA